MLRKRHFLLRTFGINWRKKFFIFLLGSIVIALLPAFIFINNIVLNIPRLCEEWFRNVLSLSAIFIIINYFNYMININRNRDKISMLITNFCIVGDSVFEHLKNNTHERSDLLNIVNFLESLLKKIQNEDEFLYKVEGIEDFSAHDLYFIKLKNHIKSSNLTQNQIKELRDEYDNFKNYLKEMQ